MVGVAVPALVAHPAILATPVPQIESFLCVHNSLR